MNGQNPSEEDDSNGQSTPLPDAVLRARLQQARGELTDYARGRDIDLSRPRLTREQLHDRKLARLQMAVANLERKLPIKG